MQGNVCCWFKVNRYVRDETITGPHTVYRQVDRTGCCNYMSAVDWRNGEQREVSALFVTHAPVIQLEVIWTVVCWASGLPTELQRIFPATSWSLSAIPVLLPRFRTASCDAVRRMKQYMSLLTLSTTGGGCDICFSPTRLNASLWFCPVFMPPLPFFGMFLLKYSVVISFLVSCLLTHIQFLTCKVFPALFELAFERGMC